MTSVSAGHIILTPTQPVGSGRPQRGLNPGHSHRALPRRSIFHFFWAVWGFVCPNLSSIYRPVRIALSWPLELSPLLFSVVLFQHLPIAKHSPIAKYHANRLSNFYSSSRSCFDWDVKWILVSSPGEWQCPNRGWRHQATRPCRGTEPAGWWTHTMQLAVGHCSRRNTQYEALCWFFIIKE